MLKRVVTLTIIALLLALIGSFVLNFRGAMTMAKAKISLKGGGQHFLCLAFSPDGKYLAAGQQDGALFIWKTDKWREFYKVPAAKVPVYDFGEAIYSLAFSPDGRAMAWGGGNKGNKQVTLLDVEAKHVMRVFDSDEGVVRDLAFEPNGKRLAVATEEGTVKFWDVFDGKGRIVFDESGSKYRKRELPDIGSICFSPDGKTFAVGIFGAVVFLHVSDTEVEERAVALGYNTVVKSLRFSPDSKTLVGIARGIRFWEPLTGKEVSRLSIAAKKAGLSFLAFSPDNKRIAAALSGPVHFPSYVMILDMASSQELGQLECHQEPVTQCAWSPREDIIATAAQDGTVKIWDVAQILKGNK